MKKNKMRYWSLIDDSNPYYNIWWKEVYPDQGYKECFPKNVDPNTLKMEEEE